MKRCKGSMVKVERDARSKAAKIVSSELFVQGSLIEMARVCGKKTCKCTRGEKHVSLYLAIRKDNKRKMIYIPKEMEKQVQALVNAYQKMKESLDTVSESCLNQLIQAKKNILEQND